MSISELQGWYADALPTDMGKKIAQGGLVSGGIHLLAGSSVGIALFAGSLAGVATLVEGLARPVIDAIFGQYPVIVKGFQSFMPALVVIHLFPSLLPWGIVHYSAIAIESITRPILQGFFQDGGLLFEGMQLAVPSILVYGLASVLGVMSGANFGSFVVISFLAHHFLNREWHEEGRAMAQIF